MTLFSLFLLQVNMLHSLLIMLVSWQQNSAIVLPPLASTLVRHQVSLVALSLEPQQLLRKRREQIEALMNIDEGVNAIM